MFNLKLFQSKNSDLFIFNFIFHNPFFNFYLQIFYKMIVIRKFGHFYCDWL